MNIEKKENSWKIFINAILIFLVVISLIIDACYIYYKITNKNYTTGTNYINDQLAVDATNKEDMTTEEINEMEERWLFEVNLLSNYKKNGIILAEMRVNSFSDYSLTQSSYISSGIQQVGEKPSQPDYKSKTEDFWNTYVDDRYYYYTSSDDVTYEGGTSNSSIGVTFNRNLKLTVKISNKPYQLQLTGFTYEYYEDWLGRLQQGSKLVYTWSNFFNNLMYSITRSSYGEGDYYLTKCDLSKYFTLKSYNENGQVEEDNLTDFIENYCVVKVHYQENGAKNVNQSIFGLIAGNRNYGLDEILDTTYAKSELIYTLNENNLDYRYSNLNEGYYIFLNNNFKNLINKQPDHLTNIVIDLDRLDKKILGIDFYGFENFKINTLTILSSKSLNFKILDSSLFNTNLKTLKYSSNIILEISENATNAEYVEVVL